jgi:hypothetical protein
MKRSGIFGKVVVGQTKESRRRSEPALLQMNEGAGKLNQSFVEIGNSLMANLQPLLFQDLVGFKIFGTVKSLKEAEIS